MSLAGALYRVDKSCNSHRLALGRPRRRSKSEKGEKHLVEALPFESDWLRHCGFLDKWSLPFEWNVHRREGAAKSVSW